MFYKQWVDYGLLRYLILTVWVLLHRGGVMRFENTRNLIFQDIHIFNIILVLVLSFLRFSFLGNAGLVIYGILLAYSVFFFFYNLRYKKLYITWLFWIIIAYYLYFFIAVCISGNIIRFGASLFQLLFICLISFYIRGTNSYIQDFISIAKVIIALSLFMSVGSLLIGIFVCLSSDAISTIPYRLSSFLIKVAGSFPARLTGFAGQPNNSARLCLLGAMFSIYLLTCEEKQNIKWKILSIVNVVISLYFIAIATNSRTSLISLFVFSFVYLSIYSFKIKNDDKYVLKTIFYVIVSLLSIIILGVILINVFSHLKEFLFQDVFRISTIKTGTGRTSIFKVALELIRGNLLFGFNQEELVERVGVASTHNLFLEVLSYGGLPSLVLYLIYISYTFYVACSNLRHKNLSIRYQILNTFLLSYIICYLICGIAERVSVNGSEEIAAIAQIVFCITHVIRYNMVSKAES